VNVTLRSRAALLSAISSSDSGGRPRDPLEGQPGNVHRKGRRGVQHRICLSLLPITEHRRRARWIAVEQVAVHDDGKYLVIWKRDQGKWRLHRDIWTTNMLASGQ
jgi:hypothetical protein